MRNSQRLMTVLFMFLSLGLLASPRAATPEIAASLRPYVQSHTLAGAVTLVADKDKTLSLQSVGFADIAAGKAMTPNALFWIASMSKPLTASALMMLVDEGKVNLDDPVEKYLPEYAGQMYAEERDAQHMLLRPPAHPIKVREVLSHTSGLPPLSRLEKKIDTLTLREAGFGYAMSILEFAPSTQYKYSNAGINTAGRIIEVVSGMPYETFLARRLLEPLGMKDTTLWPSAAQLARLAKSYGPNAAKNGLVEIPINQLTYPLDNPKRGPSPAGGYFSTASDMAIFCRMILNHGVYEGRRYLSEAAIRQLTSTQTGDLVGKSANANAKAKGKAPAKAIEVNENGYGLGFSTTRKARAEAVIPGQCGHGGAYATNMSIDPEKNLITIFMVQHNGFPGEDGKKIMPTFRKAAEEAFGK